jgi:hypothetical protein
VSQTVQQGGRHLRVTEDAGPLGEVQVGRDHHAGVLVQLGLNRPGFRGGPEV